MSLLFNPINKDMSIYKQLLQFCMRKLHKKSVGVCVFKVLSKIRIIYL